MEHVNNSIKIFMNTVKQLEKKETFPLKKSSRTKIFFPTYALKERLFARFFAFFLTLFKNVRIKFSKPQDSGTTKKSTKTYSKSHLKKL